MDDSEFHYDWSALRLTETSNSLRWLNMFRKGSPESAKSRAITET